MKKYTPGELYKQNPILKRATGQDKTNFDKFLDVANTIRGSVNEIFNNKIADNIQRLQDNNEFDKINAKSQLAHLTQFGNIQKDIEANFNNDVNAWARNYAREEVDNDFVRKQGMNISPDELDDVVRQPTAAYGNYLDERQKELVASYNAILNDLDGLGVPYRDLDASKKFIDESYENIFNNMEADNKFNLIGSIGSFLQGNGFNTTDYTKLSKQYEDNAFQAKLADIEEVNNKFKAFYAMSPKLAAQFEKTVESIDYKVMGETKVEVTDLADDSGIIVTTIQNYTDKNNNPQQVTKQEVITNPAQIKIINQKGKTFEAQENYLQLLTPKGQQIFSTNLKDDNLSLHDAFLNVPQEHKKPYDEAFAEEVYRKALPSIISAYPNMMDKFYVKSLATGVKEPSEELQAYFDGTGPKPAGYYDSPYELAQSLIPNLNIRQYNNIINPEEDIIQTTGNSFTVDVSNMNENQVVQNLDVVKNVLNLSEEKIQSIQNNLESGASVKGLSRAGEYYGNNEFTVNVNELLNQAPELTDTIAKNRSLADAERVTLGYNVKTDELIIKPASAMIPSEGEDDTLPPSEPTDRGPIRDTGLIEQWSGFSGFDISNVPVLSSEFIFGEKIGDDITDIALFAPAIKGGMFVIKQGGNFIKGVGNKLSSLQQSAANKISETVGRARVESGLDVASKIPAGKKSIPLSDLGLNAGEILLGKTKTGGLVRLVIGGAAAEEAMPDNEEEKSLLSSD